MHGNMKKNLNDNAIKYVAWQKTCKTKYFYFNMLANVQRSVLKVYLFPIDVQYINLQFSWKSLCF